MMDKVIVETHSYPQGEVRISEQALRSIVNSAIGAVPGALVLTDIHPAIRIEPTSSGLNVEVRIAVQYGAPIGSVSQNVADTVRSKLEYALGLAVIHIQVLVQGTRR